MAKSESTSSSSVSSMFKPFQLENAFIIFAIIYVPVSLLFFNRGVLAETLLILYTLALMLGGALLMARFLLFIAKEANEHNGQYGSVLIMYVLNILLPLLTFKFIAYTVWKLLPCTCERFGLFADGVRMVRDAFYLFNIQQNLTWVAAGSLVLVAVFAMWSVSRKQ